MTASITSRREPERAARRPPCSPLAVAILLATRAAAAASAASASAAAIVTPRAFLFRRPRRRVLRPLDQLLRLDEPAVLVLRDELQADASTRLVDLLDDDVDDVT